MTISRSESLSEVLRQLRSGHLDQADALGPLLLDQDRVVRCRAQREYAHCCSHGQVAAFSAPLEAAEDREEVSWLLMCLGDTLSPAALPLVLAAAEEFDEESISGYAAMAIGLLTGFDAIDEYSVQDGRSAEMVRDWAAARATDPDYYYRGRPLFMGDLVRDMLQEALSAYQSGTPVRFVRQEAILEAASGLACPVSNRAVLGESQLRDLYSFASRIAALDLPKGAKYYFGHRVV